MLPDLTTPHAITLIITLLCVVVLIWIGHRLDRRRQQQHAGAETEAEARENAELAAAEHRARLARMRAIHAKQPKPLRATGARPLPRRMPTSPLVCPAEYGHTQSASGIGDVPGQSAPCPPAHAADLPRS